MSGGVGGAEPYRLPPIPIYTNQLLAAELRFMPWLMQETIPQSPLPNAAFLQTRTPLCAV